MMTCCQNNYLLVPRRISVTNGAAKCISLQIFIFYADLSKGEYFAELVITEIFISDKLQFVNLTIGYKMYKLLHCPQR